MCKVLVVGPEKVNCNVIAFTMTYWYEIHCRCSGLVMMNYLTISVKLMAKWSQNDCGLQ